MVFSFRNVMRHSVRTAAKSSICWFFIVVWLLANYMLLINNATVGCVAH